jgi:hypothetical protein
VQGVAAKLVNVFAILCLISAPTLAEIKSRATTSQKLIVKTSQTQRYDPTLKGHTGGGLSFDFKSKEKAQVKESSFNWKLSKQKKPSNKNGSQEAISAYLVYKAKLTTKKVG